MAATALRHSFMQKKKHPPGSDRRREALRPDSVSSNLRASGF